jgi:hypothetical protein
MLTAVNRHHLDRKETFTPDRNFFLPRHRELWQVHGVVIDDGLSAWGKQAHFYSSEDPAQLG